MFLKYKPIIKKEPLQVIEKGGVGKESSRGKALSYRHMYIK